MARSIKIVPGELYHLYNRGTDKRKIFMHKNDYERFLSLLYLCNGTEPVHLADIFPRNSRGSTSWELASWEERLATLSSFDRGASLIDLYAYCLMPNHFHILAQEKVVSGISSFMQKMLTAYTMYFNTQNERTGALFQGKYKATHVNDEHYLKYLVSYIHLNPVKLIEPTWKETDIANRKRAEQFLVEYRFSSFLDYCGKERAERCLVEMELFQTYYDQAAPSTFKASVREWLNYKPA